MKNKVNCNIIMKSKCVAIIILDDQSSTGIIHIGQKVKRNQLLFRMKYLNINIDFFSPCDGIINEIYVINKTMIEYGQKILSLIQI